MDPIISSPTRNDVVKETMIRSLRVAEEMNQTHAIVTYDLAIASKAFSIRVIESPKFDKLIILLRNFYLGMAFFGAIGLYTKKNLYIYESGAEFILTETCVLAERSVTGFIKGKFYNRCVRVHQILAIVIENLLFEQFLNTLF